VTRIERIDDVENCLDSSTVREVFLIGGVDQEIMNRVAHQGRLQYFPYFPKPYFRVDRSRHWVIQGVIGAPSIRVTFSPSASGELLTELCDLIDGRKTSEGALA